MSKEDVFAIAKKWGWEMFQDSSHESTFAKEGMRITVWHGRMSVGTTVYYPKTGEKKYFYEFASPNLLNKLFENPRHHRGVGYYKK